MKKYLLVLNFVLIVFYVKGQSNWVAPEEAKTKINPIHADENSIKKGEKIYKTLCSSCHGATGKGDVPAMQALNPKPTNFTTEKFQKQTDGEIFWKISEGHGIMASYKNTLSEEEIWDVITYLRTFKTSSVSTEKETSKKKAVKKTIEDFPFTVLINAKTTHIMEPKGFGLVIQHRFGITKFDETFVTNFMGLDLGANVRFAFEIPVNDKMQFEIGRTRYGKFYDIGGKYLIFKQTKDNTTPLSIAFSENISITTEKTPTFSEYATFENGSKFEYLWYHRLYFDSQIILSKNFTKSFSAQITGEFVWRNLTPYSDDDTEQPYVIAIPVSMRLKLGLISAISLEVMPNTHKETLPISIAYEVASSGNHVFQVVITNTDKILTQNIFTRPTIDYLDGEFMLGFNLIRYF